MNLHKSKTGVGSRQRRRRQTKLGYDEKFITQASVLAEESCLSLPSISEKEHIVQLCPVVDILLAFNQLIITGMKTTLSVIRIRLPILVTVCLASGWLR